jgi:hypothetical protein
VQTAEQVRDLLSDLVSSRVACRTLGLTNSAPGKWGERLLSVETHLELATQHLIELYGQVVLAEHLHGEVVDLSTADR